MSAADIRKVWLAIGYRDLPAADVAQVTAAYPRPDFKRQILSAFAQEIRHRPESTFGNVNADVLAHYSPGFVRGDFVEVVLGSEWPE